MTSFFAYFEMKSVLIFGALLFGWFPMTAHKFEDGFVERTMAVVVRGKTASVEYSVGLNETTLREILEKWTRESQTRQETAIEPTEKHGTPVNVQDAQSAHSMDAELLARFQQSAPQEITNRIDVSCDGNRIVPESVALGPTPLHPFVLVVKFEFELPVGEKVALLIRDRNFLDNSGAVRYAIKTKGSSMLLQSNQAPILVRSERTELADMSPEEREKCTSIASRLAIFEKTP